MFPLFLNVLLTFLLFIKFGTISFQLFVHLSAPSVYIYTLQMVITFDLAQERKNLQFGIPNTFLLLLNSGKFKSLRSYKMSCFGKWIGMPTEFRINSKSVFFFSISLRNEKHLDSEKPPNLVLGKPLKKISKWTNFGIRLCISKDQI